MEVHHHADTSSTTGKQTRLYNYFEESIFSRNAEGQLLAVKPEHIEISEARKLGTIPATLKSWKKRAQITQIHLSIQERGHEIVFRATIPSDMPLAKNLKAGMVLYMRFAWDKVLEVKKPVKIYRRQAKAA